MDAAGINTVIDNVLGWVLFFLVLAFVSGVFDKE